MTILSLKRLNFFAAVAAEAAVDFWTWLAQTEVCNLISLQIEKSQMMPNKIRKYLLTDFSVEIKHKQKNLQLTLTGESKEQIVIS